MIHKYNFRNAPPGDTVTITQSQTFANEFKEPLIYFNAYSLQKHQLKEQMLKMPLVVTKQIVCIWSIKKMKQ